MICSHCGKMLPNTASSSTTLQSCPFCGKLLGERLSSNGNFQIVNGTLVQFVGNATTIMVPDGVVCLGTGAFYGYPIHEVRLPDSVVEIEANCFWGCDELREIHIPVSVTKIDKTAFRNTHNVKVVTPQGSYAWNFFGCGKTSTPPAKSAPAAPSNAPGSSTASAASTPKAAAPVSSAPQPKASTAPTSVLTEREKEERYIQMLGGKPGKLPWMITHNFFGRVDRLIARIRTITDQELLMRIAREAPLIEVRRTAVRNITNQEALKAYALSNLSVIRLAAIVHLEDQPTLRKLALSDSSTTVRDAAISKVTDSQTVREYLLHTEKKVTVKDLQAVTSLQDCYELALCSENYTVRIAAAQKLPENTPEGKLLRAAAELSQEILPYPIERFKQAAEALQQSNPDFLQRVALRYPFPGVRYLARGKENLNPDNGASLEERLKAQTPSQLEVEHRAKIRHYEELLSQARQDAKEFCDSCRWSANQGKHSYESTYDVHNSRYYGHYYALQCENAPSLKRELEIVIHILQTELRRLGLQNAQVTYSEAYNTRKEYLGNSQWREVKTFSHYVVHVLAKW